MERPRSRIQNPKKRFFWKPRKLELTFQVRGGKKTRTERDFEGGREREDRGRKQNRNASKLLDPNTKNFQESTELYTEDDHMVRENDGRTKATTFRRRPTLKTATFQSWQARKTTELKGIFRKR